VTKNSEQNRSDDERARDAFGVERVGRSLSAIAACGVEHK